MFPFRGFTSRLVVVGCNVGRGITNAFTKLPTLKTLVLAPIFNNFVSGQNGSTSVVLLNSTVLVYIRFVCTVPSVGC